MNDIFLGPLLASMLVLGILLGEWGQRKRGKE